MSTTILADCVGRQAELKRLLRAVRAREELLVWGDSDSGKTSLVRTAMDGFPTDLRKCCLYVEGVATVKELLQKLVAALWNAEDPQITDRWRATRGGHITMSGWLHEQPGGRLHRMFCESLPARPCWVFLDHIPPPTHSFTRFLKQLMWRWHTPVYLVARGFTPIEAGYAWSLYWIDKLRLRLGALSEAEANVLFDQSARRFGLLPLELEEFREEVMHLSGRLPGAIVNMCALAADPQYHFERRIKAKLVHVDYLMGKRAGHLHCVKAQAS